MNKFAGVIAGIVLANDCSGAFAQDVTATRNIRAGAVLTPADLKTSGDRESIRTAINLVGLEAKRIHYRGEKLDTADFRNPTLVERNAIVHMNFNKGPMLIQTKGRALERGGLGDRIQVMNLFSKRVITAVVSGTDNVRTAQ